MTFDEILSARYSVRSYDPARPVPPEHIAALAEAARLAPSACNSQTWRFIAVSDPVLIQRICAEGMRPIVRNKWLRDAPLIMVGCSQLDLVANKFGSRVTGIEYHQIDLGIAMEHMALKATELGLGTCWIGWIKEDGIKAVLGIPDRVRVLALLAVGYATDEKAPKRSRKALRKILFANTWGASFPES